jgi:hypothetical protein
MRSQAELRHSSAALLIFPQILVFCPIVGAVISPIQVEADSQLEDLTLHLYWPPKVFLRLPILPPWRVKQVRPRKEFAQVSVSQSLGLRTPSLRSTEAGS